MGGKEVETHSLSIRTRAEGELGSLEIATVIDRLVNANITNGNF